MSTCMTVCGDVHLDLANRKVICAYVGTDSKGLLNSRYFAIQSTSLEEGRGSLESPVLAEALGECPWQLEANRIYKKRKRETPRWFYLVKHMKTFCTAIYPAGVSVLELYWTTQ